MYAWQRRSKKPLLPPKPTDFDDVLKLTEETKRRGFKRRGRRERKCVTELEKRFLRGEGRHGRRREGEDEEEGCESWERMRTKAMEAFAKLEFKRAARWFGKALEELQIEEEEEEEKS